MRSIRKRDLLSIFNQEAIKSSKKAFLLTKIIITFALINILFILPDIFLIFSKEGLVNEQINNHFISPDKIRISDITNFLENFGISYYVIFRAIFLLYVLSLVLILFDILNLYLSILVIALHTIFLNSSFLFTYGADLMVSFMLFCNLFFCLQDHMTPILFNKIYNFTLRLMQIHLCVVYFFGGLGKAMGNDWYTGNAIWMILNLYLNENILTNITPYIPKFSYIFLSLSVLLLELCYPLLVFLSRNTRKVAIVAIMILHVSIALIIKLYTFSFAMIILNIIAFYPNSIFSVLGYFEKSINLIGKEVKMK